MIALAIVLCVLHSSLSVMGQGDQFQWAGTQLSFTDSLHNLQAVHAVFQNAYYSQFASETANEDRAEEAAAVTAAFPALWQELTDAFAELLKLARSVPALLLPAGVELYHWFFFKWRDGKTLGILDDEALALSSELLTAAIAEDLDCNGVSSGQTDDLAQSMERFLHKGCDYRWTTLVMIEAELGRELADRMDNPRRSGAVLQRASAHFKAMMTMPYFSRFPWSSPYDMNLNSELYSSPGPVWNVKHVPLTEWLETNYATFRQELDAVLSVPGLFAHLHHLERNAEGQDHAPEDDWMVLELGDTREDEPWKASSCALFKQSCELLRSRPELSCDHAAAYVNSMRPGARIKPHMGGPSRLVVHLGLIVPDEPISLYVGNAKLRWAEGRAHVIDDTYVHSVHHHGRPGVGGSASDRYILHLLICHPCEPDQRVHYANKSILCS